MAEWINNGVVGETKPRLRYMEKKSKKGNLGGEREEIDERDSLEKQMFVRLT